jgi:hypothetical protein
MKINRMTNHFVEGQDRGKERNGGVKMEKRGK